MATIGGSSFTGFRGVNLRGTATGSAFVRVDLTNFAGTVSLTELDQNVAWTLPAKSGTLPIAGTFAVNIPAFGKGTVTSTIVTVTGIRAEDGLNVSLQDVAATSRILIGAVPGNGTATLYFANLTGGDQGAHDSTVAYTAVR